MRSMLVAMSLLFLVSVAGAQDAGGYGALEQVPQSPGVVTRDSTVGEDAQAGREPSQAEKDLAAGVTQQSADLQDALNTAKQKREVVQGRHASATTRAIATGRKADWVKTRALAAELDELDARVKKLELSLAWVKQNPIGGKAGQQKLWKLMRDAHVASWGDVRRIARDEIEKSRSQVAPPVPPSPDPAVPNQPAPGTPVPVGPTITTPPAAPPNNITPPAAPAGGNRTVQLGILIALCLLAAAVVTLGILAVVALNRRAGANATGPSANAEVLDKAEELLKAAPGKEIRVVAHCGGSDIKVEVK